MRRATPFLLVVVIGLLTLGAALLGASLSPNISQPTIGVSSACDLLTSQEASSVLGGPVTQRDPTFPLMCGYSLNSQRITSVILLYVIPGHSGAARAFRCAPDPGGYPNECSLGATELDGVSVPWTETHFPADHTIFRSGAAKADKDGYAILINVYSISDPKTVVLRSMGDVLANR